MRTPLRARPRAQRVALALAVLLACRAPERPPDAGELRVISLSPSITDIVVALGGREQLVGVDQLSSSRHDLANLPSLGGLFAPDLERALELRPTVVLGVRSESQSAFFAQLRARGVRVQEIDSSGSLESVLGTYAAIGALIGREAEAGALIEAVRAEVDEVARSVAGRERPGVALILEREPLYVAAGGSFASALIDAAGGTNVFADLPQAYPQVSLELLAERAPEVLIDATQGSALGPEAEAASRAYWSRFGWVRRVELVTPELLTLPGSGLGAAARSLRGSLHPDLVRAETP